MIRLSQHTAGLLILLLSIALASCGASTGSGGNDGSSGNGDESGGELPALIQWGTLTAGSANHTESVALAEVVSKYTPMDVRVEPTAGTMAWIPMLEAGDIQIGLQSLADVAIAFDGLRPWQEKQQFIRMIGSGGAVYGAVYTTKGSGINSIADLRGKRVHAILPGVPFVEHVLEAALEANDMTFDDIDAREYETIAEANNALINGNIEAISFAIVPLLEETEAAVGVKVIPFTEEEQQKIHERVRGLHPATSPDGLFGIPATPVTLSYASIFTHANYRDDVVYAIAEAIYENYGDVQSYGGTLPQYSLENAFAQPALPYHTGAIQYFKDKGVWTDEMEQLQQKLLSEIGWDR